MSRTRTVWRTAAMVVAVGLLSASPPPLAAGDEHMGVRMPAQFWGTWYGELDAEPFGLPPGAALSALMTIHRDGTLVLFDSGDFGAAPINQVQSPMFGTWVRTGRRSMRATALFFAGHPDTRDTLLVKRIRLRLRFEGRDFDRLAGVAEIVEQLECPAGPLPGFVGCPNPITAPDSDWVPEPGGAPNVPFRAWRLGAR